MADNAGGDFFDQMDGELAARREHSRAKSLDDERAISERLKRARGELTRKYVVEVLEDEHGIKMANSTLAALEGGDRGVRLIEAVALADIYGVELTAFTQDHLHRDAQGVARVRRDELRNVHAWIERRIEGLTEKIGEE